MADANATATATKVTWKKSATKKLLLEHLQNGDIPLDEDAMGPEDVCNFRPEFKEIECKRFKTNLKATRKRLLKQNDEDAKVLWKDSKLRGILYQLLMSGTIPLDEDAMGPKDVCNFRPEEFKEIECERFKTNLKAMRKRIIEKKNYSATDTAGLAHDRMIYPKNPFNHRGEPRWEGSEAERLLKKDVEDGQHEEVTPQEFYLSRIQYQEYNRNVFLKHVHQEVRTRKHHAQRNARRAARGP